MEVSAFVAGYQGYAAGDIKQVAQDYDIPVDAVCAVYLDHNVARGHRRSLCGDYV